MTIAAIMMGANGLYRANAVDFDGTNDYMLRSSDLTGNANSKLGIINGWFRIDGGASTARTIYSSSDSSANPFLFSITSGGKFNLLGKNTSSGNIMGAQSVATYAVSSAWIHVLASWDLATATVNMYINNVSDCNVLASSDELVDCTHTSHAIGALDSTPFANRFHGAMADFYYAPGQYVDITVAANRYLFRDSITGKPVNLLRSGAPSPLVLQKSPAAVFGTNSGTGGDFVITGTLDVASTSPSD